MINEKTHYSTFRYLLCIMTNKGSLKETKIPQNFALNILPKNVFQR